MNQYLLDVCKAEAAGVPVKVLQLLKVVLIGSSQAGKTRYHIRKGSSETCNPPSLTSVPALAMLSL